MRKCLPKPSLPFDGTGSLAWLELSDEPLFRPYMAFVPFLAEVFQYDFEFVRSLSKKATRTS